MATIKKKEAPKARASKGAAKKATAKTAKKVSSASRKTTVKKVGSKKTATVRTSAKTSVKKKTSSATTAVKKTPVKKAVTQKPAAKKTVAKKAVAKKVAAKKPVVRVQKKAVVSKAKKAATPKSAKTQKALQSLSEQMLKAALKVLDDRQAQEIVTIPLAGRSSLADYMIIASGRGGRQVVALADYLREAFFKLGVRHVRIEGQSDANWVLVDAGDIIVHLFLPEVRRYYDLDALWGDKQS